MVESLVQTEQGSRPPISRSSASECAEELHNYVLQSEALMTSLSGNLESCSQGTKLELVLFTDALTHLMRISRLLSMARGSALLVGVGGSGKQSLSRLAAYIAGASVFQITITKSYNITNLFEDIKALYKTAGFKGQPVCFIFTDAEVKDEGFLEYINQILMTGGDMLQMQGKGYRECYISKREDQTFVPVQLLD